MCNNVIMQSQGGEIQCVTIARNNLFLHNNNKHTNSQDDHAKQMSYGDEEKGFKENAARLESQQT